MIGIVIPLKRLPLAKSRLADLLEPAARQRLVLTLATHVVTTAQQAAARQAAPTGIWLVSADPTVAELARALDVNCLTDRHEELNAALSETRAYLQTAGARAMVILAGDLPFITPADITALIEALSNADLALAPDQAQRGTNALALRLPSPIPFIFGSESAARHLSAAHRLGLRARLIRSPTLAFDLDDRERLQQYYQRAGCCGVSA